jgi:hypothetical protein
MKKSIRLIIFFIGIIFLMSCTVSHLNSQLIIGKWKKEQPGSYSNGKNSRGDTLSDAQRLVELKKLYLEAGKDKVQGLRDMMYTDISFKADKTVTLSTGKKNIHGNWKMNSKGNKVVITDTSAAVKHTLIIVSVDSLSLKISQPVIEGNFQQDFKKTL